jgi:hypothetical protein
VLRLAHACSNERNPELISFVVKVWSGGGWLQGFVSRVITCVAEGLKFKGRGARLSLLVRVWG